MFLYSSNVVVPKITKIIMGMFPTHAVDFLDRIGNQNAGKMFIVKGVVAGPFTKNFGGVIY